MVKRCTDWLIVAALVVSGFFLFLLICAVHIVIERTNPVFRQIRVGKDEKPFALCKIWTTELGTENVGTHEVDPACTTPLGRFLRKTKLDELPQLINVLFGEMSFVGPRPELVSQTELVQARRNRSVFQVRPGITGLAQIRGIHMGQPEALALADEAYVREMSLVEDLKIIALTAIGYGSGDQIRQS